MVEVERGPLGAFEQHPLSTTQRLHHLDPGVGREGQEAVREGDAPFDGSQEFGDESVLAGLLHPGAGPGHPLLDPPPEAVGLMDLGNPDPAATRLVFVGRPDAPTRGPDLLFRLILAEAVEYLMVGKKQVGPFAHPDPSGDIDITSDEGVVFLEELFHVEDDAVAQEAAGAGVEDAGRDLVEDEFLRPHMHGVARIGAALVAGHHIDRLRKDVDDLSLAFVAPLAPDDDGARTRSRHPRSAPEKRPLPGSGKGPRRCIFPGKLERGAGRVNQPVTPPRPGGPPPALVPLRRGGGGEDAGVRPRGRGGRGRTSPRGLRRPR